MKKLVALFLILVVILSLTACGKKDKNSGIVGTWDCEIDMTDYFRESLELDADMEMEDIILVLSITFKSNGSLVAKLDQDSYEEMLDIVTEVSWELVKEEAEEEGVTKDTYAELIKESLDYDTFSEQFLQGDSYYIYQNDRICIGGDLEELKEDPDDARRVWEVSVNGNTMKVTDILEDGEQIESAITENLPLEFKKK